MVYSPGGPSGNGKLAKIGSLLVKLKAAPCLDCEKTYPYYVMDFDHVPERGEKKFELSTYASKRTYEEIVAEVAKCDVVCSNCHRERSHQRYLIRHYGTDMGDSGCVDN